MGKIETRANNTEKNKNSNRLRKIECNLLVQDKPMEPPRREVGLFLLHLWIQNLITTISKKRNLEDHHLNQPIQAKATRNFKREQNTQFSFAYHSKLPSYIPKGPLYRREPQNSDYMGYNASQTDQHKREAQKARKVQKVMLTVAVQFSRLQGRLSAAVSPSLLTQIGSNIP